MRPARYVIRFAVCALSGLPAGCLLAMDYHPEGDAADADTLDTLTEPSGRDTASDTGSDEARDSESTVDTESDTGCPNHWTGASCDLCPGNWDETRDCNACEGNWDEAEDCNACRGNWDPDAECTVCLNHWTGVRDDCGTCPGNWDPARECNACRNAWTGDDCEVCPGNWNAAEDCGECLDHWIDEDNDCGTCPGNWDPAAGCDSCKGHWSESDGCNTCEAHWIDEGNDCGTCPGNWNAAKSCAACIGEWDPLSDCAACLNHWIDEDNHCTTCPGNWDPFADCDACQSGWRGESCGVWTEVISDEGGATRLIGDPGTDLPTIVYAMPDDGFEVLVCADRQCSEVTSRESFETVRSTSPHAVLGSDHLPVISYFTFDPDYLKVAHCNDAACSDVTITVLEPNEGAGYDNQLAIKGNGLPVVSYYDANTRETIIAHCGDVACTSASAVPLVIAGHEGDQVACPLMTIDEDDRMVFSCLIGDDQDPRIVVCADTTCRSNAVSPSLAGYSLSDLAIGADGLPVFAHEILSTGRNPIGVTRCDDADCATLTSNEVAPAESGGDNPTITMDGDGNPLVVYTDIYGDEVLRYVRCDDAACTTSALTEMTYSRDPRSVDVLVGSDGGVMMVYSYFPSSSIATAGVFCEDSRCQ